MLKYLVCILLLFPVWACNKSPVDSTGNSNSSGSIVGTITDKYRYPIRAIPNSKLYLSSGSKIDSTLSDSSGRFQFLQISTGLYTFRVCANGYDTVTQVLAVQHGDSSTLNIELSWSSKYVLGTLLIGFTDSTTVESVFHLISSLGLTIKSLSCFTHESNLPVDSLSLVRSILGSKPYLTETDYTIYVYNGVIRIVGGFKNLDSTSMADWMQTKSQLRIVSALSPYNYATVHAEEGQEIIWVRNLRIYPMIKWLDLDWFIIVRFGKM